MDIPLGTTIDDYTFHEKIGRGGFSTVYRVSSVRFGTEFAAKVLRPDVGQSTLNHASYEAELTALKNLSHTNIILLFATFSHAGCPVLVFEFCARGSLQRELDANPGRGIPLDHFASIASQVINALYYCHSQNISHCDIKPGNILIDEYGRPKLADFGIAGLFANPGAMGTMAYVAPELLQDQQADRQKADIWALGVTFAYLLDGRLPWPEDAAKRRFAIVAGEFRIARAMPSSLKHMLHKMLTVDPDIRWSAEQLKRHPYFAGGAQMAGSEGKNVKVDRRLSMPSIGRLVPIKPSPIKPVLPPAGMQGLRLLKLPLLRPARTETEFEGVRQLRVEDENSETATKRQGSDDELL
jgi:serine/threonine protein kinase